MFMLQSKHQPSPDHNFVLDRQAVQEVDRASIQDYGIPGLVLMENASRAVAEAAMDMLAYADHTPPRVLIVCGSGNNGGDGYATARHLHNQGVDVTLAPLKPPRDGTDAALNARICEKLNLKWINIEEIEHHNGEQDDLIIDGLFGTGLDRAIEGRPAEIIQWINASGRPVLAIDVPSGLDCDTGEPLGAAVQADRTVTFVALKPGLLRREAGPYVGAVTVGDIGAPINLIRQHAAAGARQRSDLR